MRNPDVAILDMYNGHPGQGKGNIVGLLDLLHRNHDMFDVRGKHEMPTARDYDYYIGTGGPGDPRDQGPGEERLFTLFDDILTHNTHHIDQPKKFLGICHTAQLISQHLGIGTLEPIFDDEKAMFTGVMGQTIHADFQNLPDDDYLANLGPELATIENRRYFIRHNQDHPDFDIFSTINHKHGNKTAITGLRSKDKNILLVQFHPEGNREGALQMIQNEKENIIALYDQEELQRMHMRLDRLSATQSIITRFIGPHPDFT